MGSLAARVCLVRCLLLLESFSVLFHVRYTILAANVGQDLFPGRYVLHRKEHFVGFRVFPDGTCRLQENHKSHCGQDCALSDFSFEPYKKIFQLLATGGPSSCGKVAGVRQQFEAIFHVEARTSDGASQVDLGGDHVSQQVSDVCGGMISFQSALSHNILLSCDAETFDFGTFVSKARSVLHRRLRHPPLAMSFFKDGLQIAEDLMWEDLGYPSNVQVLITTTHNNLWDKLAHAILHNAIADVEWLLRQGQDPNGTCSAGTTLLVYACQAGALGAMKTLLQSKASPNLIGPDGLSPLHTVTTRRDVSAAELLLVYGADPNMPNSFGDAAVHLAAQEDDSDMVGLFMGCGADQTCPGLLRRLSIIQKQPDVCGGSDACEEPLLNKGP